MVQMPDLLNGRRMKCYIQINTSVVIVQAIESDTQLGALSNSYFKDLSLSQIDAVFGSNGNIFFNQIQLLLVIKCSTAGPAHPEQIKEIAHTLDKPRSSRTIGL